MVYILYDKVYAMKKKDEAPVYAFKSEEFPFIFNITSAVDPKIDLKSLPAHPLITSDPLGESVEEVSVIEDQRFLDEIRKAIDILEKEYPKKSGQKS
jgi:hypothetical protein